MGSWNPDRPQTTRKSRSLRAQVLHEEPICRTPGCGQPTTQDDHIVPWSQRQAHGMSIAEWHARANHQGLCSDCHAAKTRRERSAGQRRASERKAAGHKRQPEAHPGMRISPDA